MMNGKIYVMWYIFGVDVTQAHCAPFLLLEGGMSVINFDIGAWSIIGKHVYDRFCAILPHFVLNATTWSFWQSYNVLVDNVSKISTCGTCIEVISFVWLHQNTSNSQWMNTSKSIIFQWNKAFIGKKTKSFLHLN